jgi:hypothetical protein
LIGLAGLVAARLADLDAARFAAGGALPFWAEAFFLAFLFFMAWLGDSA